MYVCLFKLYKYSTNIQWSVVWYLTPSLSLSLSRIKLTKNSLFKHTILNLMNKLRTRFTVLNTDDCDMPYWGISIGNRNQPTHESNSNSASFRFAVGWSGVWFI